ncbi:hypothetical protein [Phytohabitans flavus]|uniref:hypothetical protein n=1 Tax=Phytohabitans flavus TaxID=1076124 RepID=UPI0015660EFD|nr:hypothetical protein [Phytohabitans flavus]
MRRNRDQCPPSSVSAEPRGTGVSGTPTGTSNSRFLSSPKSKTSVIVLPDFSSSLRPRSWRNCAPDGVSAAKLPASIRTVAGGAGGAAVGVGSADGVGAPVGVAVAVPEGVAVADGVAEGWRSR